VAVFEKTTLYPISKTVFYPMKSGRTFKWSAKTELAAARLCDL
jgi:hypothetical protein